MNMKYNPDIHHRHSIRLREYDYSSGGAYFVTICAYQRECLFGEVVDGEMRLNDCGGIVQEWWKQITTHFFGVTIDQFTIMPNHFHGIVTIVGAGFPRPDSCDGIIKGGGTSVGGETPPLRCPTLGQIIAYFKYQSTKRINALRDNPGCPVWQRNYYEHVIRNEDDLANIRQYIADNPLKWDLDENNPANIQEL